MVHAIGNDDIKVICFKGRRTDKLLHIFRQIQFKNGTYDADFIGLIMPHGLLHFLGNTVKFRIQLFGHIQTVSC